jgi:CelD/BcsL family acetyltransferase involved in cellulose biosynthesis
LVTDLIIAQEDLDSLSEYYSQSTSILNWNLVFTFPAWLKVWWQSFGAGADLYIRSVSQRDQAIGIAPLQIKDDMASIIGSTDVCDYQDFIVTPGLENEFFDALLDDLQQKRLRGLHLEPVRPDSAVATHLMPMARDRGYKIDYRQVDVSSDLDLPDSWESYLGMIDRKQRHEIRRKMRNLQEIGATSYRAVQDKDAIPQTIISFLRLFPESRGDKAQFMTARMQNFFTSLSQALAEIDIIRFGVLEAAGKPVAMVMYFDYNDNIYLYNSAYDPEFKSMSVGIISKVSCIQDSIDKGKRKFDFLKGSEPYKYFLGGKEIPLYSCEIKL